MSVPPLPASRSGKVIQAPAIAVDPGVPGSWTGRSRSLIQGCPPSPAAEPYILERKVKWALGSIPMNKTSRGDGIQILKGMMLLKCCTQYASKFEKLSSGHRTGKDQVSF